MSKNLAFTLAEVLITMTLVGAVAAMTIPTLHYNKTKKEYSAKIKNFYSRMNNVVLDMGMDKGSFKNMHKPSSNTAAFNWYLDNIDPYYGHNFIKNDESEQKIFFKDSSTVNIDSVSGDCLDIHYDVNSTKPPNKLGYDIHNFSFCFSDTTREKLFGSKDIFFGTCGSDDISTTSSRNDLIKMCKETSPLYCTRLLQYDQWEFKDDYPYKF